MTKQAEPNVYTEAESKRRLVEGLEAMLAIGSSKQRRPMAANDARIRQKIADIKKDYGIDG